MGPITILDKSALQALSMDESVWFDAFFLANVTPIFYVETLADLEKDMASSGRSAEELVGMLAEKTPSGAFPNAHHSHLVTGELLGYEVEMEGRVVITSGERKVDQEGMVASAPSKSVRLGSDRAGHEKPLGYTEGGAHRTLTEHRSRADIRLQRDRRQRLDVPPTQVVRLASRALPSNSSDSPRVLFVREFPKPNPRIPAVGAALPPAWRLGETQAATPAPRGPHYG